MVTRRRYLAAFSGGIAVSIAGCGLLSDGVEGEASPAGVPESARGETGFANETMTESTYEDTREVAGEERDLTLTNWVTEYEKEPEQDDLGVAGFAIFASPTVSIADRSFNPFDEVDKKTLVDEVHSRSNMGTSGDLEEVGEATFTVLGEEVTFTEFESTQSVEGQDVEITLHVGDLTHDGDLLAMLGTYPRELSEFETVRQMAEGVEHPVDPA